MDNWRSDPRWRDWADLMTRDPLWVEIVCARTPDRYIGIVSRCLNCDRAFVVDRAWVVAWIGEERLGLVGPCCLSREALARYQASARQDATCP
jgi:hypothetical protein